MKYSNLNALINGSKSSRDFFLSLPVSMQMKLHEHSPYIHSAAELRTAGILPLFSGRAVSHDGAAFAIHHARYRTGKRLYDTV